MKYLIEDMQGIIPVTDEPLKTTEISEEKREYYIREILNAEALLMFDEQIRLYIEEVNRASHAKSNPL